MVAMDSHYSGLSYIYVAQKLVMHNHSTTTKISSSSSSHRVEFQVQSGGSRLWCHLDCNISSINKITVVATVPNATHHYANGRCLNLEQRIPSHLPLLLTTNLLVSQRVATVLQTILSATQRYDHVQEQSTHSRTMPQPIFSLLVSQKLTNQVSRIWKNRVLYQLQ